MNASKRNGPTFTTYCLRDWGTYQHHGSWSGYSKVLEPTRAKMVEWAEKNDPQNSVLWHRWAVQMTWRPKKKLELE